MPKISAWAKTDVGRRRKHNEDYCVIDFSVGLFGVADGMGGYEAGDIASKMVLDGLQSKLHERPELFTKGRQSFQSPDEFRQEVRNYLDRAVQDLSYEIFSLAQKQGGDFRMGTTLCALVALEDVAAVIHVGDSRCYLWRGSQLYQATEDHSLVVEQLKMGIITEEEAATSRYKNVITRAVGMADRLQVDLFYVDLQPGDRFVICSDGLHGYLQGDELGQYVNEKDLDASAQKLIDLANHRGGKDNITLVIMAVESEPNDALMDTRSTAIDEGFDILKNNPLFQDMSYSELLKVIPLTTFRSFQPSEVLVREGEAATRMFIVQQGVLNIFRDGELIASLGEGDYVGEMGIFDEGPCSATVVTVEDTSCLEMTKKDLMVLLRQEPDIGFKIQQGLIRVLCRRLRDTSHALAWTRSEWRRSVPS